MSIIDLFSTIAVALGTLGVSGFLFKFFEEKRQFRLENFHRYSTKYQEYISSIVEQGLVNRDFDPKLSFDRSMSIKIFMLFSEEFYLGQDQKLISKDVWMIWKDSISHHMRDNYFQGAWVFAQLQMDLSGNFANFINAAIPKHESNETSSLKAA
ncbi:MAG: hypothetical protein ACK5Y2_05140 [Bdellovibrionales bacterium]